MRFHASVSQRSWQVFESFEALSGAVEPRKRAAKLQEPWDEFAVLSYLFLLSAQNIARSLAYADISLTILILLQLTYSIFLRCCYFHQSSAQRSGGKYLYCKLSYLDNLIFNHSPTVGSVFSLC